MVQPDPESAAYIGQLGDLRPFDHFAGVRVNGIDAPIFFKMAHIFFGPGLWDSHEDHGEVRGPKPTGGGDGKSSVPRQENLIFFTGFFDQFAVGDLIPLLLSDGGAGDAFGAEPLRQPGRHIVVKQPVSDRVG